MKLVLCQCGVLFCVNVGNSWCTCSQEQRQRPGFMWKRSPNWRGSHSKGLGAALQTLVTIALIYTVNFVPLSFSQFLCFHWMRRKVTPTDVSVHLSLDLNQPPLTWNVDATWHFLHWGSVTLLKQPLRAKPFAPSRGWSISRRSTLGVGPCSHLLPS